MTLIPGTQTPSDSTRIAVAARRGQIDRIDDAAVFTFTPGQSVRLDFVLYGNCLDKVDCADINQVCGPNRICGPIHPVPFHGEPDLAQGRPSDLGAPDASVGDLAMSPSDLANRDLAHAPPPPDLRPPPDLLGCVPMCINNECLSNCLTNCCGSNTVCGINQQCVSCGGMNLPCCKSPDVICGPQLTCNPGNNICECGGINQPCCVGGPSPCQFMLSCGADMICHTGDMAIMSMMHD
jgi:hypothetical protein